MTRILENILKLQLGDAEVCDYTLGKNRPIDEAKLTNLDISFLSSSVSHAPRGSKEVYRVRYRKNSFLWSSRYILERQRFMIWWRIGSSTNENDCVKIMKDRISDAHRLSHVRKFDDEGREILEIF